MGSAPAGAGRTPAAVLAVLPVPDRPLQPGAQAFPLRQIAGDAAGGDVPERQAAGGQLHVVLGVAQLGQQRQPELLDELMQLLLRQRPLAHPHRHQGDVGPAGRPVAIPGRILQFADEVVCRLDVKQAGLQRHEHPVGHLQRLRQLLPVESGGGVEHRVRHPLGGAQLLGGRQFPAADRRQRGGSLRQPTGRGLLPVDVAQHDRMAAMGQEAREVARERALANAALGVGDQDHRHGLSSPR